ncbi:MAG: hypothetical protein QM749_19805 [Aquabacterium sp.]
MSNQKLQQALLALESIATMANAADGVEVTSLSPYAIQDGLYHLQKVIQQLGAVADGALNVLGGSVVRGDALDWFASEVKRHQITETTAGDPA